MMVCIQCGLENQEKAESCQRCGKRLSKKEHLDTDKFLEILSSDARERYEIKELLGRGGMAVVYKAYDRRLKRYVALKILSEELVASRFEREAILAARLEHPNIVIIHDTGKEKGKQHISMSYIEGDTLQEILDRNKGPFPLEKAVEIIKEICAALSFAHEQSVIHRDIKPSNIMIDQRGRVIVTDFGIARVTTDIIDTTKITTPGMIIGTPHYMSPEQIEGREVDKRTDIYATGMVFYEMLTGRLPFEADAAIALGIKKMTETPKPPRELNPSIPEELERIVLKATQKEPEKRYQDMETLSKELEEYREIEKERKRREEEERKKTEELRKKEDKKEAKVLRLLEEDERKWEETEKKKKAEERFLEEKQKAEGRREKEEETEEKRGIKLLIQERRKKREKEEKRRIRSLMWRHLRKGLILIVLLGALAYILFKVVRQEPAEEPVAPPPEEITDFPLPVK